MTFKILNNTGLAQDTMVYNEDTAERLVPGTLPVKAITILIDNGEPVKAFLELDYFQLDLGSLPAVEVRMRIPGTQEVAAVAEIRYKDGRVFRLP